ncbi:LacI family DNA-binding transcriptional regulator [Novosphingobium aureum]|uniref:LacI family DNA-binding transcriptional regulator n=1 Tax=Novosphingobium aureum TaxID=2792964 RepID=UPI0018CD20A5|nr:LacI family DNA-binding transcriptional regulator [Novosphingobium aureum]
MPEALNAPETLSSSKTHEGEPDPEIKGSATGASARGLWAPLPTTVHEDRPRAPSSPAPAAQEGGKPEADTAPDARTAPVPEVTKGQHALTIEDIARLSGVSTKTVSRVLNHSSVVSDAMRARVEGVIARTGFVPNAQARALALRRNFLVALVHDGRDRGIAEEVEDGLLDAMADSDYALLVHRVPGFSPAPQFAPRRTDAHAAPNPDTVLAPLTRFIARHRPAGLLALPPLSEHPGLAEACTQAGVSCLRIGATRDGMGLAGPDRAAMAQAVSWLVAAGHRRIALVSGPETGFGAQAREMGYLDAMADHGLDRGPSLIEPGDYSRASGLAAGRLLLELSPRPSAILACNDAMAAGVLQAAHERALAVPGELSVIGFDDTPLAELTAPPLSSVHLDWRAIAAEAFARIVDPDRKHPSKQDRPLDAYAGYRLVERGSNAPLAPPAPRYRQTTRAPAPPPGPAIKTPPQHEAD